MQEQIKAWAEKFGLKTEQVEQGVGALLGFVRSKVPAGQWDQLKAKVPQAEAWIQKAKVAPAAAQGAAQGFLGKAMETVGKVTGSAQWSLSQVIAQLQQAGFTADNATAFAGEVMGQLKSTVGPEKFNKLLDVAPPLRDAIAGLGKFVNKS